MHVPLVDAPLQAVALTVAGDTPEEILTVVKAALESDEDWRVTYAAHERRKHPKPFEYTRSITVNAPVAKVFAITKDPHRWMGAYPGMEVSDVQTTAEGVGTTFRWAGKIVGIPFSGTHECVEYVPDQRFVSKSSVGPVFTWTFEPVDGGTELTMHVVDSPGNWAEAAIDAAAARLYRGNDEIWLAAIKADVEAEA